MHHCMMAFRWQCMCANFLCAPYTFLLPMESPYSSEFIWHFYVHSSLALLGSEAQQSLCEICPTSLATFLGFLRFFMDLLVQDSIWIYLFFMAIWTYLLSLFWGGGHCITPYTVIVLHCWTKPQARRARPVQCAGWGCSLLRGGSNRQLQQHQGKVIFLSWKLGIHLLLLIYCHLLLWHLLSI